jgi:hypothetical protein
MSHDSPEYETFHEPAACHCPRFLSSNPPDIITLPPASLPYGTGTRIDNST